MGLPLCRVCKSCQKSKRNGHIPADDTFCTICGHDETIEEIADLDQQQFMILLDEKLRLIQS